MSFYQCCSNSTDHNIFALKGHTVACPISGSQLTLSPRCDSRWAKMVTSLPELATAELLNVCAESQKFCMPPTLPPPSLLPLETRLTADPGAVIRQQPFSEARAKKDKENVQGSKLTQRGHCTPPFPYRTDSVLGHQPLPNTLAFRTSADTGPQFIRATDSSLM